MSEIRCGVITGLLARSGGELADQILVGVAEGVAIRRELCGAELSRDDRGLRVPVRVGLAELVGRD
jgi:hypothetical protein